jgi:hypothetical protein
VNTLEGICASLKKKIQNDVMFTTITTRVVLRTGVNLTAIRPDESMDLSCVTKVRKALSDLGYEVR